MDLSPSRPRELLATGQDMAQTLWESFLLVCSSGALSIVLAHSRCKAIVVTRLTMTQGGQQSGTSIA
jgi:hypothetical protein